MTTSESTPAVSRFAGSTLPRQAPALWLRQFSRALGGITCLAALLRFPTLDVQSFWSDESVTVLYLLKPDLRTALEAIPTSESTPPLYYLIAWAWARVAGTGEVGVRLLPALLGTLTVPVVYSIGTVLVSRRVGILAGALVAVNPLLVWYSQEARAHALLVFLAALSMLFFWRSLESPTPRRLAWWALTSSLALATHYFAVFAIAPEALWLILATNGWRRSAAAVGAVAAVGLALLPLAFQQEAAGRAVWIRDSSLPSRIFDVPESFITGETGATGVGLGYIAALLGAVGANPAP